MNSNKSTRTNKSNNKNSAKNSANFNAKTTGENNKTVKASTQETENKKIVKADVVKNGEEIKQEIVTTKIDEDNKNQTRDFTATTPKTAHIHKPSYPQNWWLWAIIIIGSTLLAGGLATLLGGQMFNFRDHVLPPAVVPKIVFPIAWAIIYVLIGVSGFLVFLSPNQTEQTRRGDIIWFCINLFFNIMWPLFFFRLDMLILSTIICGIVLVTAIITNYRFYYRNLAGGILYSIYTLWLMYAFYLNLGICLLNT